MDDQHPVGQEVEARRVHAWEIQQCGRALGIGSVAQALRPVAVRLLKHFVIDAAGGGT